MSLKYEPTHAVQRIVLVGCGGTGSQWARNIARIVFDMRRRGYHTPSILFVDPDVVCQTNIGRQMYTGADVGQHKAELLARRFNYTLGLGIEWANEPFDPQKHVGRTGTLLCGAVDNHEARRALARVENATWLDAGNSYTGAQLIAGCSSCADEVLRALDRVRDDAISVLPNAALVFPSLLDPEPEGQTLPEDENLSCGALVERGDQHILINDEAAAVAAQYTYRLLYRLPLTSFLTFVSIDGAPAARSVPITREDILAYVSPGDGAAAAT